MLRKLHLVIGAIGAIAFLLTGQYMHWFHAHLHGMADGPRLIFRSSHIYLLWSSLINLFLGCYIQPFSKSLARFAQVAGSVAVLAGPALLGWSFFFERYNEGLSRPVGRMAIYLALGGAMLHLAASFLASSKHTEAQPSNR